MNSSSNSAVSSTNQTNAVGTPGAENAVTSFPYYISRCDQVLHINAKYIKDMSHMCNQEAGFLTMSLHRFNIFNQKDINKLIVGFNANEITDVPKLIEVSNNCIQFTGKGDRAGVCFDSDKDAKSVLDAYASFTECRQGSDLSYRRGYCSNVKFNLI